MTLRRSLLLAYAAPAVPLAMMGLPLNVHLPAFWSGAMGLRLGEVGLVLALVRLLDLVVDPAIGRWSDRLRLRFGRRRLPIALALPVGVAGGLGLFFPSVGAGVAQLFVFYALLTLGWSLISLPWQAWGAELSPDYRERTRITAWRETGTLLGVVASAVLPVALGVTDPGATLHLLGAVSLALAAPAIATLLLAVPEPPAGAVPVQRGLFDALRGALRNKPFRRLLGAWLLNGIANGMPAALFVLLCTHLLQAPDAFGPILLVYFLSGIAGVPLWAWIAGRTSKHRAWCWAMLLTCAAFLPVLALGAGDVGWFLAICVATGLGLGADLALPPAMQADVVEMDELDSGENRAGLFFAAWTMAQKAGNALAAAVALGLLDLAGFQAAGPNTPFALWALALLYCAVPVVLKLAAVATMWRFPLDGAAQARIRQRLDERRAGSAGGGADMTA